jgi:uncharacterized glyoxalase superfamily protein PhnB
MCPTTSPGAAQSEASGRQTCRIGTVTARVAAGRRWTSEHPGTFRHSLKEAFGIGRITDEFVMSVESEERPRSLTGQATVLLVDDVRRATGYYRDVLGFDIDLYRRLPDHYGYAKRDGCHIHFAHFDGAKPNPNSSAVPPDMFDIYLWVDDVDELFAELVGRGAEIVHDIVDQGYGQREFRVRDLDGYILAFGRPLPS